MQPWSYLFSIAEDLVSLGNEVILITDGQEKQSKQVKYNGFQIIKVKGKKYGGNFPNSEVIRTINDIGSEVVFLHLGLSSFFHMDQVKKINVPIIGVFTSPIYGLKELIGLGPTSLLYGYKMSISPIIGLFVTKEMIITPFGTGLFRHLIVESQTVGRQLIEKGVPSSVINIIRPKISENWFTLSGHNFDRVKSRQELGFTRNDMVVGFFGPPPELRGLPDLIQSVNKARKKNSAIKILILSRKRENEFEKEHRYVEYLLNKLDGGEWSKTIPAFLPKDQLIQYVAACDVVCLPFKLVPSDMPLSVLEAMALGVPVVTTNVACLSEIVPEGMGICVNPGNIEELTKALVALTENSELRHGFSLAGKRHMSLWREERNSNQVLKGILSSFGWSNK